MKIEDYTFSHLDGGYHVATVFRHGPEPFPPGVRFLTEPEDGFQIGTIRHPVGHVVAPHYHVPRNRSVSNTSEVLFVVRGRIEIDLYYTGEGDSWELLDTVGLQSGDAIVIVAGGHSIRVVEECEMIEIKQGPYAGRRVDKTELVPSRKA